MRFHSTHESIANRNVTVLALIECVVAVGVYLTIIWRAGSIIPLAVAITAAPLFLLRTSYSVKLALGYWEKIFEAISRLPDPLIIPVVVLAIPMGVVIRIAATVVGLFRHPLATVRNMPNNWFRQAFCTDFFSVPEIIPGESQMEEGVIALPRVMEGIPQAWKEETPAFAALISVVLATIIATGYVPAVLLRISFKASSPIYIPLVWVARATVRPSKELKYRLERYTKSEIEKTRRWVAGTILILLASKVALVGGLVDRDFVKSKIGSDRLTDVLLAGSPWWHITLGLDALLTFFLFYYADAIASKLEKGLPIWNGLHQTVVSTASFARALIAVVTVVYGFAVAALALALASSPV